MENYRSRTIVAAAMIFFFTMTAAFAQKGETTSYNGHTYALFESGISWTEARIFCEEQGGHLATITSRGEQKAITQLLKSGSKKTYWVGGYRPKSKGVSSFTWITGEKLSYTSWNSGAPAGNKLGNKNAMLLYKSTGKWLDENGDKPAGKESNLKNFGFICEWDDDVSPSSGKSAKKPDDESTGIGICMDVGDKIQLFAPEGTKWSSSDTEVAKVNSRGVVTALAEGTAVITARGEGSFSVRVEN